MIIFRTAIISINKASTQMSIQFKYVIILIFLIAHSIEAQNGLVRSYYSNGSLESAISYVNDVLDGTSRYFYEDGVLKEEITYSLGILNGWIKIYYENGAPKEDYYVKEGKKDGVAREFYNNGGLKLFSIYNEGKLKQSQFVQYDSSLAPPRRETIRSLANTREQAKRLNDNLSQKNSNLPDPVESIVLGNKKETFKDVFYTSIDEFPRPLGGPSEIFSKVIYPEKAKQNKTAGIVVIKAFIDKDGNPVKTEVIKGIGDNCEQAAIEAIMQTKFSPAKLNGKNVRSQILIPVKFKPD
jgi:TonB family protein